MKCFNHPQNDAIGMCKNCQKGLCSTCVVDVGNGLACRSSCEESVRLLNKITDKSIQTLEINASHVKGVAIFFLILGVAMLLLGVTKITNNPFWFYETGLGTLFLLFSFKNFSASRKLAK